MQKKRIGDTAVIGAVLAIAALTLFPAAASTGGREEACMLCGWRSLADFVLNVALFVPFGAAVAFRFGGRLKPVVLAALFSLLIEVLQIPIIGRDANARDLVSNTLGGAVGMLLYRTSPVWLGPPKRLAHQLSVLAVIAALSVLGVGAYLIGPAFPDAVYYGQWTAELGHMETYRGQVLSATVGDMPVPSRRARNSQALREMLRGGTPIYVRFVAGPEVPAVAPIFSIYDGQEREILVLGADRGDGVYRYRMRSGAMLDNPDLRLRGAMRHVAAGDTTRMVLWRRGRAYCMTVGATQACNLGFRVGRTWGLLLYGERLGAIPLRMIDVAWIALLFLPAGLWWRTRRGMRTLLAITFAGLAFIPFATGILHTTPVEYAAAFLGMFGGKQIGDALARWRERAAQPSASHNAVTQRSMRS